jgi:hypothetical protein
VKARKSRAICLVGVASITCVIAYAGPTKDPFAKIPAEQRSSVAKRLSMYVAEQRTANWAKLYDLVSDVGKGSVTRQAFVAQMKAAHGSNFANSPDLLEFRPDRSQSVSGEWDIYGCGRARREGATYRGIAVVHAVFQHNDWFFTGWSFTEFPNEPCEALSKFDWTPPGQIAWDQPMEELRKSAGTPVHIDPNQ